MEITDFSTEELQLAYRVADALADVCRADSVEGHVLRAASEILRAALRARTIHDPLPGQVALTDL